MLHGVTTQKTSTWNITAVKASKLFYFCLAQTVCGHLKDFCMKARVDEMKQRSNDNSPQHEAKPIEINGESGQSAVTDSNPSLDRLDLEPKFPLLLLQTHAPCQQLELLHKEIKAKFTQILTVTFRPVPSHPDFYFCTPNWEKNQLVSLLSLIVS
jgi:hypothetical protein